MAGEQSLFEFRRQSRAGQKAQLEERIAQLAEESSGLSEQRVAKSHEIELIGTELESIRKLWQQKLVSIDRLTALERDAVRLDGEHGQLTASIAQAKGRIAETRLQIIQVDQDLRKEVATELRDVQSKISEFVERKVPAEDQLKRIDIRSPQDGVVHQLAVHTVGGVITPGEVVMLIVPVADELTVEARVAPQDIDQLKTGQEAGLKFSAFNQRVTPELNGRAMRWSTSRTAAVLVSLSVLPERARVPCWVLRARHGQGRATRFEVLHSPASRPRISRAVPASLLAPSPAWNMAGGRAAICSQLVMSW